MCGITGIIDFKHRLIREEQIWRMTDMLSHRGPDSKGIYCQPGVALGHRRLAVIDLSKMANQPLSNESGDIRLIVNGMIYNYLDLRTELESKGHIFRSKSDSEVIVHLYEEYAEDCFSMLRGMFAIAIWDNRKSLLILARDRIGQKPMVYAELPERFYFASEPKAILASGEVSRQIDVTGLHHLFSYKSVPWPYTMYKHIKQLPPASILRVSYAGRVSEIKRYWNLDLNTKVRDSEAEAAERILFLLNESVRLRLKSDVSFGALLSGGLDSSAVVSVMSEILHQPVETYSIGFSDKSQKDPEFVFSNRVSQYLNTSHHQIIADHSIIDKLEKMLWHYDEPYTNPVALANFHLCHIIKRNLGVALSGDGSDEVFAGYPGYQRWMMMERLNSIIPLRLGFSQRAVRKSTFSRNLLGNLYTSGAKQMIEERDTGKILSDFSRRHRSDSLVDGILHMDLSLYNLHGVCTFSDISGMSSGLEIRSPFLDHKLIEYSFSLPARLKTNVLSPTKSILRKAIKNNLPREIIYRKKASYGEGIPFKRWFKTNWKDKVSQLLLEGGTKKSGFFRMEYVRRIFADHMAGRNDNFELLWSLTCFSVWYEDVFLKNRYV